MIALGRAQHSTRVQVRRTVPYGDLLHAVVAGTGVSFAIDSGKRMWNSAVLASADVVAGAAFRPKRDP